MSDTPRSKVFSNVPIISSSNIELALTKLRIFSPGLGFRPMPDSANVESTLIYYRANDKGSVLKWAKIIDEYLDREYTYYNDFTRLKLALIMTPVVRLLQILLQLLMARTSV